MDMWMDVDTALAEVPVNIMPLLDSTDFKTIEDAVAYNASGLALYWHFVTTGGAYSVTAVTPTTAGTYDWTDQGTAGIYTIEIPASGGASINNDTEGFGWFTGVATGVLPWRGPVIGFRAAALNDALIDSAWSTTRGLAGTALPNAAADAAGGLVISDAGGLDADAQRSDVAAILVDTGTTLDGRLPAALVSGRIDASVGAMASGVLTATAIAADAITDAKVASDVTIASVTGAVGSVTGAVGSVTGNVGGNVTGSVGSVVGAVGSVTGAVGSVTGNVGGNVTGSVGSVAAGGITAASIAADAIGASELASDAVAEIADAVWDEVLSGHLTSGTTGAGLNAAGSAGDPWSTSVPGAYGAGTAGKILGDNLNATVSSRASQASVDTIDGNVDAILVDTGTTLQAELDGIQADTEDIQTRLPAALTGAGNLKADAQVVSDKTGYAIASGGIISGAHAAAELNAMADAFLDRNMATGTDSGANNTTTRTVRQALRRLRNKESIAAGTLTITKEDDSTTSWTATVTTTAGDPLSAVDPA